MTLGALLALGSSVDWGVSDFLGGRRSATLSTLTVLLVSQVASLLLLAAGVVVLGAALPPAGSVGVAALAGLGEVVGVAALYRGLAVGVTGVVSPASAAAPVIPLAAGLLTGELLTPVQGLGLVAVVVGVVLTAASRADGARRERVPAGIGYGLLSAAGFGTSFVGIAVASEASVPWALLVSRSAAVVAVVAAVLASRSRPVPGRGDLPALVLIGALIVAADAAYATSTTLGDLSTVAVLAAFHPVVTILLARVHTRERLGPLRQLGVAVAVGGIIAITAT